MRSKVSSSLSGTPVDKIILIIISIVYYSIGQDIAEGKGVRRRIMWCDVRDLRNHRGTVRRWTSFHSCLSGNWVKEQMDKIRKHVIAGSSSASDITSSGAVCAATWAILTIERRDKDTSKSRWYCTMWCVCMKALLCGSERVPCHAALSRSVHMTQRGRRLSRLDPIYGCTHLSFLYTDLRNGMLFPNPATTYWSRAVSIALIAFCLQSEDFRGKGHERKE